MINKYYVPKRKVKINCHKCGLLILGTSFRKFCSLKCKAQFNEKKLRERGFVLTHRNKIDKILGTICESCGKESNEIHHKTYKIPIRKINYWKSKKYKVISEKGKEMLIEYCKYLVPLCSKCHNKLTFR